MQNAEALVQAVLSGELSFDQAVMQHLEDYQGPLEVPTRSELHWVIASVNAGLLDRVIVFEDESVSVSDLVRELGLEPFLPLLNRQENARFKIGDLVTYEGDTCRVLGRRPVTPLALLRFDDWELYLETLDGKTSGFICESQVQLAEEKK